MVVVMMLMMITRFWSRRPCTHCSEQGHHGRTSLRPHGETGPGRTCLCMRSEGHGQCTDLVDGKLNGEELAHSFIRDKSWISSVGQLLFLKQETLQ